MILELMRKLSDDLGVDTHSLRRLDVGFNGRAYAFPMRNSSEHVVGIMPIMDKVKCCVRGSQAIRFRSSGIAGRTRGGFCLYGSPVGCAVLLGVGFNATIKAKKDIYVYSKLPLWEV